MRRDAGGTQTRREYELRIYGDSERGTCSTRAAKLHPASLYLLTDAKPTS